MTGGKPHLITTFAILEADMFIQSDKNLEPRRKCAVAKDGVYSKQDSTASIALRWHLVVAFVYK